MQAILKAFHLNVTLPSLGIRVISKKQWKILRFKVWSHPRRWAILVFNFFFDYDFIFKSIGVLNRIIERFEIVFDCYAINKDYANAYTYRFTRKKIKFKPWLVGFIIQNGRIGLKFVTSCREQDMNNKEGLTILADRMERIRVMVGAKEKTFAGILPGVLVLNRVLKQKYEQVVTITAVVKALFLLIKQRGLPKSVPIIILGAKGFVGRLVVEALQKLKMNVFCVDVGKEKNSANLVDWPSNLYGEKTILINIARSGTLALYLNYMWKGMIVLNETYGDWTSEINILEKKGIPFFHIPGVKALSFPCFPFLYKGFIPLCAAWDSPNMRVGIKLFNKV
jgi:hypothetical protein